MAQLNTCWQQFHVPEARIAAITAAAMSSNFSAILLVPMLDVRFSRRWYATFFAGLTSILIFIAVTNLHHLVILEIALLLTVMTAGFSTSALGGWLATVCPPDRTNNLSAWVNIALIGGTGITSASLVPSVVFSTR